jgi:hypothetical protein
MSETKFHTHTERQAKFFKGYIDVIVGESVPTFIARTTFVLK